ncbi:MAG: hypothetical protein QOI46_3321 [Alphaproteobacteria bacterium]|nr:hypothetical protein [Alphaproteobacteria bacterium]
MFDGIIEANFSSRTAESRLINDPGDADGLQLFTWACRSWSEVAHRRRST